MAHAQSLVEAQPNVDKLVEDHLAVQSLIRAYQVSRGWLQHRQIWYSLGLSGGALFYFSFKCQQFPFYFDLVRLNQVQEKRSKTSS
jgi:hypothetical protein